MCVSRMQSMATSLSREATSFLLLQYAKYLSYRYSFNSCIYIQNAKLELNILIVYSHCEVKSES